MIKQEKLNTMKKLLSELSENEDSILMKLMSKKIKILEEAIEKEEAAAAENVCPIELQRLYVKLSNKEKEILNLKHENSKLVSKAKEDVQNYIKSLNANVSNVVSEYSSIAKEIADIEKSVSVQKETGLNAEDFIIHSLFADSIPVMTDSLTKFFEKNFEKGSLPRMKNTKSFDIDSILDLFMDPDKIK